MRWSRFLRPCDVRGAASAGQALRFGLRWYLVGFPVVTIVPIISMPFVSSAWDALGIFMLLLFFMPGGLAILVGFFVARNGARSTLRGIWLAVVAAAGGMLAFSMAWALQLRFLQGDSTDLWAAEGIFVAFLNSVLWGPLAAVSGAIGGARAKKHRLGVSQEKPSVSITIEQPQASAPEL